MTNLAGRLLIWIMKYRMSMPSHQFWFHNIFLTKGCSYGAYKITKAIIQKVQLVAVESGSSFEDIVPFFRVRNSFTLDEAPSYSDWIFFLIIKSQRARSNPSSELPDIRPSTCITALLGSPHMLPPVGSARHSKCLQTGSSNLYLWSPARLSPQW